MEAYVKRCAATKLTSAEKLMYICKNQLGKAIPKLRLFRAFNNHSRCHLAHPTIWSSFSLLYFFLTDNFTTCSAFREINSTI